MDSLLPDKHSQVFLFVQPPKSLRKDPSHVIQCQQVQPTTKRIKPILNLEYHRLLPTSIVELERDDAKVAELKPIKSSHIPLPILPGLPGLPGLGGGGGTANAREEVGRKRSVSRGRTGGPGGICGGPTGTLSTSNTRGGPNGGTIKSVHGHNLDMQITGSEAQGRMIFRHPGPPASELTWVRMQLGTWMLQATYLPDVSVSPLSSSPRVPYPQSPLSTSPRTVVPGLGERRPSFEFLAGKRNKMQRLGTSATMASQYTTLFDDESIISAASVTPIIDSTDAMLTSYGFPSTTHGTGTGTAIPTALVDGIDGERGVSGSKRGERGMGWGHAEMDKDGNVVVSGTTLSAFPVPHLRIYTSHHLHSRSHQNNHDRPGSPNYSDKEEHGHMADKEDDEVNEDLRRILISALWISWSARDIIALDPGLLFSDVQSHPPGTAGTLGTFGRGGEDDDDVTLAEKARIRDRNHSGVRGEDAKDKMHVDETARKKREKGGRGFFGMLARMCGSKNP